MKPAKDEGLSQPPKKYYSYLLRLWQEETENGWDIYLHDVNTGIRRRFLNLESLLVYLQIQMNGEQDG